MLFLRGHGLISEPRSLGRPRSLIKIKGLLILTELGEGHGCHISLQIIELSVGSGHILFFAGFESFHQVFVHLFFLVVVVDSEHKHVLLEWIIRLRPLLVESVHISDISVSFLTLRSKYVIEDLEGVLLGTRQNSLDACVIFRDVL